jgi:hypothetical protein
MDVHIVVIVNRHATLSFGHAVPGQFCVVGLPHVLSAAGVLERNHARDLPVRLSSE